MRTTCHAKPSSCVAIYGYTKEPVASPKATSSHGQVSATKRVQLSEATKGQTSTLTGRKKQRQHSRPLHQCGIVMGNDGRMHCLHGCLSTRLATTASLFLARIRELDRIEKNKKKKLRMSTPQTPVLRPPGVKERLFCGGMPQRRTSLCDHQCNVLFVYCPRHMGHTCKRWTEINAKYHV
ncbi:hypothetical protein VTI28DRAFT_9213 [Corynascus sepedonium]